MKISNRHILRVGMLIGSFLLCVIVFLVAQNVLDLSAQVRSSVVQMHVLHNATRTLETEIERQHIRLHELGPGSGPRPELNDALLSDFLKESRRIQQRIDSLESAVLEINIGKEINVLRNQYKSFVEAAKSFLNSARTEGFNRGRLIREVDGKMRALGKSLDDLQVAYLQNLDQDSSALENSLYESSINILSMIFVALVSLWGYFFIADAIFIKPTRSLVEATKKVAAGELEAEVHPSGASEIRNLGESFNKMLERLRNSQLQIEELTESLERKVEERTAELVESQDYLDRIIYGSPVGIAIFDAEGVLRDCNVALATMLGSDSPEECINVISVGDAGAFGAEEFRLAFQATKREEVIRTDPLRINDAGRQWFSHHLVPFYSRNGELTRIICYSVDVSAEKTARDQLIEKNKELESFIYSVSHDLKAPLFTISGLASILKSEMASSINDRQANLIDRILFNMGNMETLINDLLDLSRAGAKSEKFTKFTPNEAVRIAFLEEKVRHSAQAELKLQDNLPEIYADRALIVQLFRNLISNSFKYRSKDRDLEISLESSSTGRDVTFRYIDNGQGIDPKNLTKIFDVFFSTAGPDEEGSGVGLTIVKRIIESHGGQITVESTPGEGATFIFALPSRERG